MSKKEKGLSRRMKAILSVLIVAIVVGVLISYEQIALLYVLATLGIVALLVVVGWADLESVERADSGT